MTNISDDRIKELREWALDERLPPDFVDLCDEHAALKARAEKAEAALAQAKKDYDWMMAQHDMWKACAFKEAELKDGFKAELAKQAPLIQAVMGLDEIDFIADDWPSEKLRESADKLRSEK